MNLSLCYISIFLLILTNGYFTSTISNSTNFTTITTTTEKSIHIEQTTMPFENTTNQLVLSSTNSTIHLTTEQSSNEIHNRSHLLLTTIQSTTQISEHKSREFHEILENSTQPIEITTHKIFSSTIKLNSTKHTSTSRKSFTKFFRKLTTPRSTTVVTTVANNVTINDRIYHENENFLSRKKYMKIEEVSLSQIWTLLLFLLAAFLFFICILVSALACVKNRHTIKRKSRITEMEAHLDEHYLHYPQPLLFQQLH